LYCNSLDKLLPKKLIPVFILRSGISPNKQVNQLTKDERLKIVHLLKNFIIDIKDIDDIKNAIVTAGGVNVKEINPKTMESKLCKGLYFAGEVIDVDGYTGGYNLTIAFSSGYTAGNSINQKSNDF
jgi:predicted Rossmann fold flavoprotein